MNANEFDCLAGFGSFFFGIVIVCSPAHTIKGPVCRSQNAPLLLGMRGHCRLDVLGARFPIKRAETITQVLLGLEVNYFLPCQLWNILVKLKDIGWS